MAYFTKRYNPPGTAPGTLQTSDIRSQGLPFKLRLIEYSADTLLERGDISITECTSFLQNDSLTWIHAQGEVTPKILKELGSSFGLHPLALEDVINTGQRPKLDHYDQQLFAITCLPLWHDEEIITEQVSLFLGRLFVVSFHNGEHDPFEPIRQRLRSGGSRIRSRGSDYLFYALLDLVIDQGFPILEDLGELIEEVEEKLLDHPPRDTLALIHQLKRNLLLLRRMLWPQREVLNQLIREDHTLIKEETRLYLRDCYDHTIQIMDLFETYRDTVAGMLDIYLSSTSNRLNDIMRVLTVITTLFIPPTFLVGVYGMNFTNMPELHWHYGYLMVWLITLAMISGMLLYFKRRNWF